MNDEERKRLKNATNGRSLISNIKLSDREILAVFDLADDAVENLKACLRVQRTLGRIPPSEINRLHRARKKIKEAMRLEPVLKAALLHLENSAPPIYREKATGYLKTLCSGSLPDVDPDDDEAFQRLLEGPTETQFLNEEPPDILGQIDQTRKVVAGILNGTESLDKKIYALRRFSTDKDWVSEEARKLIADCIDSEKSLHKKYNAVFLFASNANWRDLRTRILVEEILSRNVEEGDWIRAIDCLLNCEDWRDERTRGLLEEMVRRNSNPEIRDYAISGLIERPEWQDDRMQSFVSEFAATESGMRALKSLAGNFARCRVVLQGYGIR